MIFLYSGGYKHIEGVGFALDQRAMKSVIAFEPHSSRLVVLTLSGTVPTHIFSVYALTEASPDETRDNFYTELQNAIDIIPQTDLIIIAGDLATLA